MPGGQTRAGMLQAITINHEGFASFAVFDHHYEGNGTPAAVHAKEGVKWHDRAWVKSQLLSARGALILLKLRPPSRPDRQWCQIPRKYEGKFAMQQATTGRTTVQKVPSETPLLFELAALEDEDRGATFAWPAGDRVCVPTIPGSAVASMYGCNASMSTRSGMVLRSKWSRRRSATRFYWRRLPNACVDGGRQFRKQKANYLVLGADGVCP